MEILNKPVSMTTRRKLFVFLSFFVILFGRAVSISEHHHDSAERKHDTEKFHNRTLEKRDVLHVDALFKADILQPEEGRNVNFIAINHLLFSFFEYRSFLVLQSLPIKC